MFKTFVKIFKQPLYLFTAIVVFAIVLSVALIIQNLHLISEVFGNFGLVAAIKISFSLLGSLSTNFTVINAVTTVLLAILFGINISLTMFYFKRYKQMRGGSGVKRSTLGMMIGIFGVGCASCGSVLLTSIFSFLGIGGALAFLPFGGQEFAFIGLAVLMIATYFTLKKVHQPITCKV